MVVLSPLVALPTDSSAATIAVLVAGLALGTPILSLLGAIGAALTLGVRGGGSLLALLVLPLYVPVLIFGAGAVDAVRAGCRRRRASVAARRGTAAGRARRAVRGGGCGAHRAGLSRR